MKFGVREICDVVLKAKAPIKIGNKQFYKHEPVIYFDSLKTSSLEGAATTVYAQGGRGNSRLIAWEGERTVTFTMEDALISPAGFMILSGAGLIEGSNKKVNKTITDQYAVASAVEDEADTVDIILTNVPVGEVTVGESYTIIVKDEETNTYTLTIPVGTPAGTIITITYTAEVDEADKIIPMHATEQVKVTAEGLFVSEKPYVESENENYIYVMVLDDNGDVSTEPYIYTYDDANGKSDNGYLITPKSTIARDNYAPKNGNVVLVDYYIARTVGAQQIEITADKFGGNYYLEASTLFRNTNGVDMPAEFIIPNCKIQSNFTFTMASSGDPSTFTFTMDAFPDYTRFEPTKKVLAAIQFFDESLDDKAQVRTATKHDYK